MKRNKRNPKVKYKNGKMEIITNEANRQMLVMCWFDFIINWIWRFTLLFLFFNLHQLEEIIKLVMALF